MLKNNDTCSLDLSKNWSNSIFVLTCTKKFANEIPLSGQALWFDKKRNLIYCSGGFKTYVLDFYVPTLFKSMRAITPDEKGIDISKKGVGPTKTNIFLSNIKRPFYGGFYNKTNYDYDVKRYKNS